MIANFKQWDSYWNNFNNGDEALFQDASLPRDTFWFKIKNWIQTAQQDWRTANANIDFRQAIYAWLMVIPSTWWVGDTLTEFKESYSNSDLSFVDSFTPCFPVYNKHPISWWQEQLKVQRRWDSWTLIRDWSIMFNKSGSYIIQAVCQFIFPDWYNTTNSYQVKEYVVLYAYDKEKKQFVQETKNQARWCWTDDLIAVNHITRADAWQIINLWVSHTYWQNVMCRTALNVYRLS